MPDVTFTEMRKLAADIKRRNGVFWFKFTCCGVRQDVEPPDVIHQRALCAECGHLYDFVANGGGIRGAWMLAKRTPPAPDMEGY